MHLDQRGIPAGLYIPILNQKKKSNKRVGKSELHCVEDKTIEVKLFLHFESMFAYITVLTHLFRPFLVNELEPQYLLHDRRKVYEVHMGLLSFLLRLSEN